MEKEIRDIKEFILINVIGIYDSKDIDKDFEKLLEQNRKYIKEHKKELPDRSVSNNLKHTC